MLDPTGPSRVRAISDLTLAEEAEILAGTACKVLGIKAPVAVVS
jgi:hypothetical protein